MRFEIEFRPASEAPAKPLGTDRWPIRAALILNPCDGYHHVFARWNEDGDFLGFTDWADSSPYEPGRFFIAWSLLPDEHTLIEDMRAVCG